MENKRGRFINLHNIITVNDIGIIELHKELLCLIHRKEKKSIVVTFTIGIPTSSIKYVPIIPNEPVQENHIQNILLSSGRAGTGNSKGYKTHTYINSYVKEKDTLPTHEKLSPIFQLKLIKKPKW